MDPLYAYGLDPADACVRARFASEDAFGNYLASLRNAQIQNRSFDDLPPDVSRSPHELRRLCAG